MVVVTGTQSDPIGELVGAPDGELIGKIEVATTAAVLSNNVKIRWLDVDLNTANISLEDLKNKLNEYTKIIYLVHWGGMPVDLDELDKICEEHKVCDVILRMHTNTL